jgi:hypothetical protein
MITVSSKKFDEIERMMAHIGEGVSALQLLARSGCGCEGPLGNDALFFIARALQTEVDAVLDWHEEIINPGNAKD